MQALMHYVQANSGDFLFGLAAVLIFFLIARILKARQSVALAFAFMPVLIGWAFTNPGARLLFNHLF